MQHNALDKTNTNETTVVLIKETSPAVEIVTDAKRILPLDGLRGIAILIVVLFHYLNNQYTETDVSQLNGLEMLIMKLTSLGWAGVNLFFVLSGFLIGSILLRNKNSGSFFKVFYMRRFARIIPIYYLLLLLYIVIRHSGLYTHDAVMFESEFGISSYFLFLQNFYMACLGNFGAQALTPTWSLAVEEQFYLIIPWIVYLLKVKHLKYFIIGCLIMAPACRYFSTNWYASYTLLFCRVDSPVIGFLLAYLMHYEGFRHTLRQNQKKIRTITFAVILLCGALYLFTNIGVLNHTILGAIFGSFVLMVLQLHKGAIFNFLTSKWLLSLGKYSYCIYLFHQIINQTLHLAILGNISTTLATWHEYIITLVAFGCTYSFAWVSFKFFEKPLLNWSHHFKY